MNQKSDVKFNGQLYAAVGGVGIVILFLYATLSSLNTRGHLEVHRRSACVNNLKQIGIALYNYHGSHKVFPPAYIADAQGKPMHSWRVVLLPYFEDDSTRQLAEQYNFDEPWNSPHNRALAGAMPAVYRCPSDESNTTQANYAAVVGPQTGWPGTHGINARDVADGTSNTIAVVEVANAGIHWMEPRDLTFEQAAQGINPRGATACISSNHTDGANVLLFDASVHYLQNDIPPDLLRALLTANGGEPAEPPTN